MKIILYSMIFLFLSARSLSADTDIALDRFFSAKEKERVLENEIISRCCLDLDKGKNTLGLAVPKTEFFTSDYKNYELVSVEKAFIPCASDNQIKLKFYNDLIAFSELAGVRYYSITDEEINPFILKSSRIKSENKNNPLNDIRYKKIIPKRVHFFQIEDNRFGKIIFRSEIYSRNGVFILKNISTHSLKKFGFKINEPGEYSYTFIFFYDKNSSGYFYYALQALRIRSFFIRNMGIIKGKSFANRLRAMTVHFAGIMGHDWSGRLEVE